MGFFHKKYFHYRVDTTFVSDPQELESYLNDIASTVLFHGRWKLHTIHQEVDEMGRQKVMTIFEREI